MPSRIRNSIRHYDVEKNEDTRYNYDKKKIAIIIFIIFVCVLIAFGILFKIDSRDNCKAKSMKYSNFENHDNATESQDNSKTSLLVTSSIMEDSSRQRHVTDEDNTGTITTDKETESYDNLETSSLVTSTENNIIKKSSSFNNEDDTVTDTTTTTTDKENNITTLSLTKTTDQVMDYKLSITQDLSSSTVIYEQSSTEGI